MHLILSLQDIIHEIDEDESGCLEFPEFIQLAAKFLIEEDEEQMKWELKEAFRIYDKHGTKSNICYKGGTCSKRIETLAFS